jgi:type I site-specific restriction-modification system R (restriction) subunit
VFWHTQGSGKSYSMVFFAEKVRRKVVIEVEARDASRPWRLGSE